MNQPGQEQQQQGQRRRRRCRNRNTACGSGNASDWEKDKSHYTPFLMQGRAAQRQTAWAKKDMRWF